MGAVKRITGDALGNSEAHFRIGGSLCFLRLMLRGSLFRGGIAENAGSYSHARKNKLHDNMKFWGLAGEELGCQEGGASKVTVLRETLELGKLLTSKPTMMVTWKNLFFLS